MHFTKSLVLATVVSTGTVVVAGPIHALRHAQFHDAKRAVGDKVTTVIDGQEVSWINTYAGPGGDAAPAPAAAPAAPAAAPASSPAEAPAAQAAPPAAAPAASNTASNVASNFSPFCKRATAEQIATAGNTGECGYASNIKLVADDLEDKYQYTLKFVNNLGSDASCGCSNKVGSDGGVSGSFGALPVTFPLAHGASQVVAIDAGSIGFCTCHQGGDIPKSQWGQNLGTWAEFELGSEPNNGWNGLDISAIAAQAASSPVTPAKLCVGGSGCSSVAADGTANNAYNSGNVNADGVGLNIPPTNNLSGVVTLGG